MVQCRAVPHDEESAALDALRPIFSRYFPIVGELCRIDLADATPDELDPRSRCDGPLFITPWYVTLGVRTSGFDKMDTDGALTVSNRGQLLDPRTAPCLEGQLMALTTVATAATKEIVRRYWAVGYLNTSLPPTVLPRTATKDDFCRYFLTYPWLGRYLPDRPAKAPAYVLAPADECQRDGKLDIHSLWTWIYRQVARTFEDTAWDEAMIAALPEPVRVLEAAHMLCSMAGGNGLEVWLSQARGADIRRAHHALGVLGAAKLQALMTMGIALAAHQGAEFVYEHDAARTRALKGRKPGSWREIDGHEPDRTYALLDSELVPAAQQYAEKHRAELIVAPRQAPIRRTPGRR